MQQQAIQEVLALPQALPQRAIGLSYHQTSHQRESSRLSAARTQAMPLLGPPIGGGSASTDQEQKPSWD